MPPAPMRPMRTGRETVMGMSFGGGRRRAVSCSAGVVRCGSGAGGGWGRSAGGAVRRDDELGQRAGALEVLLGAAAALDGLDPLGEGCRGVGRDGDLLPSVGGAQAQ